MSETSFRFTSRGDTSGLMASGAFPGGFVAVDLAAPDRPFHLFLEDESGAVGQGFELPSAGAPPRAPDPVLRHAIVNGVDRWFDLPHDRGAIRGFREDVLQLDVALARAETGQEVSLDPSWAAGEAVSRALLAAVLSRPVEPVARELRRILEAAPYAGERELTALDRALGRHELGRLASSEHPPQPERRSRPRQRVVVRARGAVTRRLEALADPRLVPARLLAGEPAVSLVGAVAVITVPAHPSVDALTPGSERLLARAVTDDGDVVAVSRARLSDGTFTASVDLRGRRPTDLTIELFDGMADGGAYVSREQRARADRLRALQSAFTWSRVAGADRALGRTVEADIAQAFADNELAAVPGAPGFRTSSDSGPGRPLLAELVAESGLTLT